MHYADEADKLTKFDLCGGVVEAREVHPLNSGIDLINGQIVRSGLNPVES